MQKILSKIKKNPYRYINLTIFITLNFLLSSSFFILSNIYKPLKIAYKINIEENWLGLSLVMFGSFLITILNSFYLKKIGLVRALRIYITLATIGAILRCFLDFSTKFLFFGQFVCGLSNSFFFNSQMAFANLWFPKKFHKLFFDILFFFGYSAVGFMGIVPFFYIDESLLDVDILQKQIKNYFFSLAIFAVVLFFITFFLFKKKTIDINLEKIENNKKENILKINSEKIEKKILKKNPKKKITEKKPEKKFTFTSYKKDLKKIFTNSEYIKYFLILIIQRANFSLIISSINITFDKNNFREIYGSITILILVLIGSIGSIFYNKYIKRNKLIFLFIFILFSIIFLELSIFSLNQGFIFLYAFFIILQSFFIFNFFSVFYNIILENVIIDNKFLLDSIISLGSDLFIIFNQTLGSWILSYFNGKGELVLVQSSLNLIVVIFLLLFLLL